MKNKKEETHDFSELINTYIKHLEAQFDVYPLIMELLAAKTLHESKLLFNYIQKNQIKETTDDGEEKLFISGDKIKDYLSHTDKVSTSRLAMNLIPENFVVSFVSQYDAFLGNIIRTIYKVNPQILNNSDKNILFSDLTSFKNIEDAQEFIIEKEVESVLRDNHIKQFKWLENKLGIPLRKDLPSFSHFVEITERRNLLVHCNGVISRNYLKVCKENDVKGIENYTLGDKLEIDMKYFYRCYSTLLEIGVKLGQVIWRKLQPEMIEKADLSLNQVCYDLLSENHFGLSLNLLTFATDTIKKHHDQEIKLFFIINKALAYYLTNKKDKCNEVIAQVDWSATSIEFKLAIAVLQEDNEKSFTIMKQIGNNSTLVNKDAYRNWPLFREFRKDKKFKIIYKDIFNEDFVYIENKPKELEDILKDVKDIRNNAKKGNNK